MSETNATCPECGRVLPEGTPASQCPNCLIGLGLEVASPPSDLPLAPRPSPLGPSFGDYELLAEIARGGTGVVYKARQVSLNRLVAVKMILAGEFATPQFNQRFRTEASAAAVLHHPNIVAIHEVGVHTGQHYFSMDFVEGPSLAALVGHQPLPARRAAQYLKTIAEAIHYAHEQGILHRDLKPSNVLIDANDQPRITDFGLAKRLEGETSLTLSGQMIGSPNFMPPEQATARHGKVGRYSDVYALGGILYYLLTARPPFQADSLEIVISQVLTAEPISPRQLIPTVPRDLETICLRCLEKEPPRRYASAQALADELGRFLENKPILARPVGAVGKTLRWCRRKPALAVALGAVVVVAAVGFAGVLSQWRSAQVQRDLAVRAQARAELKNYDAAIAEAQLLIEQNRFDRAREILAHEEHAPHRGWEWGWLQRQANQDLICFTNAAPVMAVAFSPDGRSLAAGGYDQTLNLWDLETGRKKFASKEHSAQIWHIAFSPDGRRIVTACADGKPRVWDAATGQRLHILTNSSGVWDASFSPDGKIIATGPIHGGVLLWNAETGNPIPARLAHDQPIATLDFSQDGRRLACGGGRWAMDDDADTTVSVLDPLTGQRLTHFDAHRRTLHRVRFNPDGNLLATTSADCTIRLWDAQTGDEVRLLQTEWIGTSIGLDFSPDGRWLAVSGLGWSAGPAKILEVATGRVARSLVGHALGIPSIAFNPDGTRLATAGFDGATKVWATAQLPECLSLEGHEQAVWCVAFSPDGKRVASGSLDLTAAVWDAQTGARLATLNVGFPVITLAFSPDGERLVTAGTNHTACIWTIQPYLDSRSSRPALGSTGNLPVPSGYQPDGTVGAPEPAPVPHFAQMPTSTPSGRLPLGTGRLPVLPISEAAADAGLVCLCGHTDTVTSVAWSSDGRLILTGGRDGTARLWNAEMGAPIRTVLVRSNRWITAAVSPDGQRFATGTSDGIARIWDTESGRLVREFQGHEGRVQQLAFSPDGSLLATGSSDRKARLFDATTGRMLFEMEGHRSGVSSLAFSPDGSRLATAGAGVSLGSVGTYERAALIWDVRTGQRLLKLDAHVNWVIGVAFSPDGRRLATSSADNTVRVWEAFPWKPEDYAAESGSSPAEKMESFKRHYWQPYLAAIPDARSPATPAPRPGRRLESYYGGNMEWNLSVQRGTKTRPAHPIPAREPDTDTNCIDLTGSYNLALTEVWQPISGPLGIDSQFPPAPANLREQGGVNFDVRGVIRLSQASWGCAALPTAVEIPLGRTFRRLHVLHGTAGSSLEGERAGVYRLHYDDGTSAELPILHRREKPDRRAPTSSAPDSVKAAQVREEFSEARQARIPVSRAVLAGPGKWLYQTTYENPSPEREVVSITFESSMTASGPFLLALTVEP